MLQVFRSALQLHLVHSIGSIGCFCQTTQLFLRKFLMGVNHAGCLTLLCETILFLENVFVLFLVSKFWLAEQCWLGDFFENCHPITLQLFKFVHPGGGFGFAGSCFVV